MTNMGGGLLAPIFLILILGYWAKLLNRAKFSIQYWPHNRFIPEIHSGIGDRPSLLAIIFPTVGWVLARTPTWIGPTIYSDSDVELFLFFIAQITAFAFTIIVWTGWWPEELTIPHKSVKYDHYPFFVAIISIIIINAPFSLRTTIVTIFGGLLLISHWIFDQSSSSLIIIIIAQFVLAGGVYPYIFQLEGIYLDMWFVLMTFFIAYFIIRFGERYDSESIEATIVPTESS